MESWKRGAWILLSWWVFSAASGARAQEAPPPSEASSEQAPPAREPAAQAAEETQTGSDQPQPAVAASAPASEAAGQAKATEPVSAGDWETGRTISATGSIEASGLLHEVRRKNPLLVLPRAILAIPRYVLRYGLLLPLEKLTYFIGRLQGNAKFQVILLSFYRVGFRPSIGLRFVRYLGEENQNSASVTATYGGRNFQSYEAEFRHNFEERNRLKVYAKFRQQGDKRFYGIGNDLDDEDLTRYFFEEAQVAADVRKFWVPRFSTQLVAGWKRVRTTDTRDVEHDRGEGDEIDEDNATLTDRFSPEDAPGFGVAQNFLMASATATLDLRRDRIEHELGLVLEGHLDGNFTVSGKNYSNLLYGGSVTGIVPVFRDRVIAGRLLAEGAEPLGDEVPYYLLPALGRGGLLRGLASGRFRDQFMAIASLEYRWPLAAEGDGVLFFDTGRVSESLGDFELKDFKWGAGFGLRYNTKRGVLLSFQVAYTSEGSELLLLTGDDVF